MCKLRLQAILYPLYALSQANLTRNDWKKVNFDVKPGRIAQSLGHLTRKSEVLGSIPGLATYFRFSFP